MIGSAFAETVLSGPMLLAIPVALLAGLVSFASPCVLPLVPGYVGYVGGMAGADDPRRGRLLAGVGLFVAGFTVVFVALTSLVTSVGMLLVRHQELITRVLGVVVILLGLAFLGAFPFLQREARLRISPRAGLLGAPLLGVVFAIGWVPCIGPTLGAVLALAYDQHSPARALALTVVYCAGLGAPFLAVALGLRGSRRAVAWLRRHRVGVMRFGGILLTLVGLLLVTGLWTRLTLALQGLIDGYTLVI